MSRVKRGSVVKKYRKKILKFNKGFVGSHSLLYRIAKQQNMRALRYSYIDRKKAKRSFRKLWIKRINSASRLHGKTYNELINKLKISKVVINRKILAQLCLYDFKSFLYLMEMKS